MGLQELKLLLLENNTNIQLEKQNVKINEYESIAKDHSIDWNIFFSGLYEKEKSFSNSSLDLSVVQEKSSGLSLGFTKKFLSGLEVETSWQTLETHSNSINAIGPRYYTTAFKSIMTYPLMRNEKFSNHENYYKNDIKKKRADLKLKIELAERLKEAYLSFAEVYLLRQKKILKLKTLKYYEGLLKQTLAKKRSGHEGQIDWLENKIEIQKVHVNIETLNLKYLKELYLLKRITNNTIQLPEGRIPSVNIDDLVLKLKPRDYKRQLVLSELSDLKIDRLKESENNQVKLDLEMSALSSSVSKKLTREFTNGFQFTNPEWSISINFSTSLEALFGIREKTSELARYNQKLIQLKKHDYEKLSKKDAIKRELSNIETKSLLLRKRLRLEKVNFNGKKKLYSLGRISFFELKKKITELEKVELELFQIIYEKFKQKLELADLSGLISI